MRRISMHWLWALAWTGTTWSTAGCTPPPCNTDQDCKGDRVCDQGACVDSGGQGGAGAGTSVGPGGAGTGGNTGPGGVSQGGAGQGGGSAGGASQGGAGPGSSEAGGSGPECGNGMLDPGETCDVGNLGGATCQSEGYDGGSLKCTGDCIGFNEAGCCKSDCTAEGDFMCDSPATQVTCGNYDNDACMEWGNPMGCPYGCSNGCLPAPVCSMSSSPGSGSFTPSFAAETNCSCLAANLTCHTLYQAKVASIAADGWHATLRFKKADGSSIPAGRKYWIVVGASSSPTCDLLNAYVVRKSGTVGAATTELEVADVPIWPDQGTYDADDAGTTKNIFLITDGSGVENQKIWFEKKALVFTKTCQ